METLDVEPRVPYLYTMNMKGLSYPVHTGQIDKFEMQNDVSVNVIGYEDGDFFPVYVSKHRNKTHNVDFVFESGQKQKCQKYFFINV
jgi:hypothetical protein